MEFKMLSSLPDGGSSPLKRGEDILCHPEMTDYANGCVRSGKIHDACPGYRANCTGATFQNSGCGDARTEGKKVHQAGPSGKAVDRNLLGDRTQKRGSFTPGQFGC
jgi:hypothetical protein